MHRHGWHILWQGDTLVLARAVPVRFDVSAQTRLPSVRRPLRLAQQVRQDLWRALRDLRGFSPCVSVAPQDGEVILRAGGRAAHPVAPGVPARIAAVLEDGANRARWTRWAA
ncbi:hypothetical protein [Salipiger sp.]|uniref:hypothetical protein n=1 Tax=Salipiger sp. TaxID=2078585 RepID=UPI003A97DBB1